MENVFDILKNRGFVEQVTDEHAVSELLSKPITCYIGFDPTASTLHVGSLLPIMALTHMQKSGHKPIVLIGGGTGMIGDPSGKTKAREVLTKNQIEENALAIKKQFSRYIDFGKDNALLLNNADWLLGLGYIEFLRDIGCHFSVNRMLTAESYKARLKTGLNFIEFNYMLLQAYDFLYLSKQYQCLLQMGGNDQWGNILAGIDLTRRVEGREVYGITFPLIVTASGDKMGKTEKGAIWLDESLTSPYEYYQFWINVDDADVGRFLKLFTFLPQEEIIPVERMKGEELNNVKKVLAFEATKITHGEKKALEAWKTSVSAFGCREIDAQLFPSSTIPRGSVADDLAGIPTSVVEREVLEKGISAFELFTNVGLCSTRSEARRLIGQKGGYVNGEPVSRYDEIIGCKHLKDGNVILRSGKKKYHRIIVN
ncbi:MAG: tyrosine--tRNA ligase [Deltaproteobacteria bacterium]|nr:tyrosine--tRNA ligase [Deltaproteobacteria bacterium]